MDEPRSSRTRWLRPAPERALALLSLGGLACYGALWLVHQTFYRTFGVSLAMVGIGQAQIVTAVAVALLLVGSLLVYPAVLFRLAFMSRPFPRARPAAVEALSGCALFAASLVYVHRETRLLVALEANGSLSWTWLLAWLVRMAGILGFALLMRGSGVLFIRRAYRWLLLARKWLLVRRYLRHDASGDAVIATYLPARRGARKRAAERRAAWRRDLEAVGRTYRLVLAALLGLGFSLAVATLATTAQRDAQAQIAGRKYETSGLYDILTAGAVARPVEVIAHDSRLQSLEKDKVLYLGTHDGVEVLYDRTGKHAVLVPAGSVTLVLLTQ